MYKHESESAHKTQIQLSITRITKMETLFNLLSESFGENPDCLKNDIELQNAARLLSDYLSNGEWLQDHDLDEQKILPTTLKRGVLSEDGLYNLLCDIREWSKSDGNTEFLGRGEEWQFCSAIFVITQLEDKNDVTNRKDYRIFSVWNSVEFLALEAFPPEEYLAPKELVRMSQEDHYDFLALMEGTTFVGFIVTKTFENMVYLFFLAIDPTHRSGGYGSQAIQILKGLYPGKQQVVDFEMLDNEAPNNDQRTRRRNFYLRNGYQETGLFLSYLGVDYEVFCMDDDFQVNTFKELMKTIQVDGFNPRYFTK